MITRPRTSVPDSEIIEVRDLMADYRSAIEALDRAARQEMRLTVALLFVASLTAVVTVITLAIVPL